METGRSGDGRGGGEAARRPGPRVTLRMVSFAVVLVARTGRDDAAAAGFRLGGIKNDQVVIKAGTKTSIGYREMDEDRGPVKKKISVSEGCCCDEGRREDFAT